MPKVMESVTQSGEHHGWMVFCPGCECGHEFDSRWTFNGDMEKPTFRASMLVNGNVHAHNPMVPRCHSFVTDGNIEFLSDCTHKLAGQTLPLPDWDKT